MTAKRNKSLESQVSTKKLFSAPLRDLIHVPGITDVPIVRRESKIKNIGYDTKYVLDRHFSRKHSHVTPSYLNKVLTLLKVKDKNYK